MSRLNAAVVVVVAGVFFPPGLARAQVILMQRCSIDSLGPAQAVLRLDWARRCALAKLSPASGWDTGIPAANGGTLVDYTEPTPDPFTGRDAYTGSMDNLDINYVYSNNRYRIGQTVQEVDANGYYKWSRPGRDKPRPFYPTYGSHYDINNPGNLQLFPHPTLANCNFYFDRNGTQPASSSFYVNGFCEPAAALSSGAPMQSLSGSAGSTFLYEMEVPAGATNVVFETSGGTGDVDLYVRRGAPPDSATYDCRPFLGGNNEGCNIRSPAAGTWYVMLSGFSAYSGVTLKATVNRLLDGDVTPVFSGSYSSEQRWTMDVPAGMSRLTFTLAGAAGTSGDADLYVRYGVAPDVSAFDCRPYMGGNYEQCSFNAPAAGTWHVMARGYSDYANTTLVGGYVTNLARGKPVMQSSVSASGVPERAVDGNTDGYYPSNSTTHTQESLQSWWQVDLQGIKRVENVVLHNRTDCCSERLNNFKVMLSTDGVNWQEYAYPGVAPQQTPFTVNRQARFVRVQLNGNGILSLAEVQVFGHP